MDLDHCHSRPNLLLGPESMKKKYRDLKSLYIFLRETHLDVKIRSSNQFSCLKKYLVDHLEIFASIYPSKT